MRFEKRTGNIISWFLSPSNLIQVVSLVLSNRERSKTGTIINRICEIETGEEERKPSNV
jgi:hypothetical protein